jgi:multisubunit Na+/H+ antiporter MnhE subunit
MLGRLRFWIAWFLPLMALWLAFVGTLAAEEVLLGLVAAAFAATAADLVRSRDVVRFRMEMRWLRGLGGIPWQVLRDTWLLAAALWRHLRGRPVQSVFRVVPFPVGEDDAREAARRALATGIVSVAPNTMVVGVEDDQGMLVHQLVPQPGSPVPPSLLKDPR